MRPVTAWLLRYFPYSLLVKKQSWYLRASVVIFIAALLFAIFYVQNMHTALLATFSFAFLLVFISSFLPRMENKVTSLVTQTGALELLNLSSLPTFTYEKRDDDIYIRFANLACHAMFAEDNKSLIGKPINRLVMIEDEEEMLSVCFDTLNTREINKNHNFYIRSRGADGRIVKLICVTSKIKWLEQYIGICFLFDISHSENQYAEMQAHVHEGYMSTLVAGIVHDFRNVLTSIIGTAEALQFTIEDKAAVKQLDVIIDASERGSDTITELLQLSSSGQSIESSEKREITNDLKSIFSLLRLQLPVNVQLNCNIEKNLPAIQVTTTELEQILMNLVNNAAQAMDKDHGTIAIHVSHNKADNTCLNAESIHITVSDNGKGIAEQDLHKVTENFWTSRKSEGGTGLGLAMVKRIVNNLGGKLDISSELGVGTQISICFPLHTEQRDVSPTLKQATPTATASQFQAQPCTILLVDDQPSVLHVQQMLLEAMGHSVITSLNGQEAIKIFDKNRNSIQMVVTDFKMPDMDGIGLAKTLRKLNPNLPLLMVTGYGETEKINQAGALNMTIILKPTNLDKLSKAITETQLKYPNIFS